VQIVGCHPYEYQWLVDRAGCEVTASFKAIKAVDSTGRIHGMIGYNGWTETMVIMHIALENPAAFRSLLRWAFVYPFEQAGRQIALATVRATNTQSMNLCKRVGFKEAYRVKDGIVPGEDMIIFEMRRDACQYLSSARKAA
jgi:RimJ/RimL family protein N-acetyltransferase